MNAIPVTSPATVTEVLQPAATLPLSIKKKAVAANIPIEITQNEIPTKSSEANKTVSAFATPDKPIRATAARANNFSFFIKNSLFS
jgi:thiamine pyrophosphate-dependent acetolactate synthase large subunit-like protein